MNTLLAAREQMALSLGWHIVLACFGAAFPAMIFVVHRRGLHGDADALVLAKRWSKVAALLFAIGAVSGTVLSFEMGLLWPGLMRRFGDVIGLPFAIEGLSFFVEAIFLGLYLYGWDRLPPKVHVMTLVPMALAGVVGTFCIISVNAWMNTPGGFRLGTGGRDVTDVDPLAAMFNRSAVIEFVHMWLGAYILVGFCVAAVYAVGIRRGRDDRRHRMGFAVPFAFASIAALIQPLSGHLAGQELADSQPAKLAAMELALDTQTRAPLIIGGFIVDGRIRYGITIPAVGSFLAQNRFDATVQGLADTAPADRAHANVVHTTFQLMVMIGTGLALLGLVYWIARRRRRDLLQSRWFLLIAAVAGPLSVAALELGWVTTELGRQPWMVWQIQRVSEAITTNGVVRVTFPLLLALYTAMTVAAVVILRSMARRWRAGEPDDLATPYGPPGPTR